MAVTELRIERFRNIAQAELVPGLGINLLTGPNGSGKTSVLEALHMLTVGRSFRTHQREKLVAWGANDSVVFGRLTQDATLHHVGWRLFKQGLEVKVDGRHASTLAEVAMLQPVMTLDTQCYKWIDGSAEDRRRFIDWGVFHVEHDYNAVWTRYRRVLRQRNAALQQRSTPAELLPWDQELIETGQLVTDLRRRYVDALQGHYATLCQQLGGPPELQITLGYRQGWPDDVVLVEALRAGVNLDREHGYTRYGPHRADVRVTTPLGPGRDVLSRGQQKLVSFLLALAQVEHLRIARAKDAVVLVDDLPAELDVAYLARLYRHLASSQLQTFITATDPALVPYRLPDCAPPVMFHVEQGTVKLVV